MNPARRLLASAALIAGIAAVELDAAPSSPSAGALLAYAAGGQIRTAAGDAQGSRALARGDSPSWSPDGRFLVFQSSRIVDHGRDLYVIRADGREERRIVTYGVIGGSGGNPNDRDDFEPAWSPTDDTIAFTSDRSGNREIWTTTSTGHRTGNLTVSQSDDQSPAWSPDGRLIAFVSDRDGNDEIYTMRFDGSSVRRLTHNPAADRAPAWSPDGRELAFASTRDGDSEIYVLRADGTGLRRLTDDRAADSNPSWSRDGGRIAFTRTRAGESSVFAVAAGGGDPQRLTPPAEGTDDAAWRPGVELSLTGASPPSVRRGRIVRVRLAVTNRGAVPAVRVRLTAAISADARIVSARSAEGGCAARPRVACSLGAVTAGRTTSVLVELRPLRCGTLSLHAAAASPLQLELNAADNEQRLRIRVTGCDPST